MIHDPWTIMSGVQCWRSITTPSKIKKSITELTEALHVIWDSLPQEMINKAVKISTLRLRRYAKADGEQFDHTK